MCFLLNILINTMILEKLKTLFFPFLFKHKNLIENYVNYTLLSRLEIFAFYASRQKAAPMVGKVTWYYVNYNLYPTAPRILGSPHYIFY